MYLPPRRPFLPFTDVHRLLNNNIPTYIIGDFNGRHRHFGNGDNNTVGKSLVNLINQGKMLHLGPHFSTFISVTSATSPDKILSNKHNYLNYLSEPGEITTSDHLPMILRLSTQPFIVETPPTYKTNKANWELFKETLDNKIHLNNLNNCNLEQIETATNEWMEAIKKAIDKAIPKTSHTYVYQLKTTPEIRNLENQFNLLQHHAEHNGWTNANYREYIRIRAELRERCKENHNKNWDDKIRELVNYNKNSKEFWNKVNILKGKNIIHTNYMKDKDGNKYYTDKEKCTLMERTWRDVFRITDEEEAKFDRQHSDHIDTYININHLRVSPYPTSNICRLSNENTQTSVITKEEIKSHVQKFKYKAPGSSGISKIILQNCTDSAFEQLTDLYNACYSAGYFPQIFKRAIIKFIPKNNKSPIQPINYRPI